MNDRYINRMKDVKLLYHLKYNVRLDDTVILIIMGLYETSYIRKTIYGENYQ